MDSKLLVKYALAEDVGSGDVTSKATVPANLKVKAVIVAREEGRLAGISLAGEVFRQIDPSVKFKALKRDGSRIKDGTRLAEIHGHARAILTGERTALNLIQRLSGIATLTDKFVSKVKGTGVKILDTRKTTPCLRAPEKYAVKMGGGTNHRFGLFDGVLIKDNHVHIAGGIKKAVKDVRKKYPRLKIEVETQNLAEVSEAMGEDFDIIMLDNMSIPDMKKAVKMIGGMYKIEISGGVNIKNIRKFAKIGADFISIGALTHSAKSLNISMDILL